MSTTSTQRVHPLLMYLAIWRYWRFRGDSHDREAWWAESAADEITTAMCWWLRNAHRIGRACADRVENQCHTHADFTDAILTDTRGLR
jgi:hypothetical protein